METTALEIVPVSEQQTHFGEVLRTDKEIAREKKAAERDAAKAKKAAEREAEKAKKAAEREKKSAERAAAKAIKQAQKEVEKAKKTALSVACSAAANKAMKEGDEIALKEAAYHDRYVKSANSDLYLLLQIIMAFVEKIIASEHQEGIIKNMRHTLKHTYHIGTQKNTSTASIAVRYVTRTSRKNACVYARVINKAIEDGVKSEDLIDYIEKHQGIDNIRKQVTPKEKEPVTMSQEEIENKKFLGDFGKSYLNSLANSGNFMGKFKLDNKFSSTMIDATRSSNFKYFACDYVNGEYVIVDVVPVDPDFEPVLFERISNYRLQCSVHKQEVADAMYEAAKANGRTFEKPLYISKAK